ncbi:50S ribosomal protein L33 [Neobacillus notoginsengisoli]|uniref:Large ribosomal subunit protein bL33 n=1 Tax=Neobacillus notoginsengisoli TaxID=1578198 RepID=A0A417YL66_9BACI|nr:50S ribosomal protein L33 [Neobacillus notoginsengisoli]RHW33883.1 50S ribosomal protein L33 [Neobacillus notoginsengisoli]
MSKKVALACVVCGSRNYTTTANNQANNERLELKKYCKTCNASTVHKETK